MNDVLVRGVTCISQGRLILDVNELSVARGERVAIIGPNGAGKSTLLRVLGGAVRAERGSVSVLGQSPSQLDYSPARRRWFAEVGQLHQGLHLVGRLSAMENVLIGALHRVPLWRSWVRRFPSDLLEQAICALQDVGLREHAGTRTDRLSGGERQKVSLARLQLQQPRLILADEPTSALDPHAARQVAHWLGTHLPGITRITVVHQTELLPLLCDRVLALRSGRIVWDRPVAGVSEDHLRSLYGTTHE